MKKLVMFFAAAAVLSIGGVSYAIQSRNIDSCPFTTMIQTSSGLAYACSSYPQQVQVADYYSTAMDLQTLQAKIIELENRVKILESKPH
jgi:hypothetical protein